MFGLVITIHVIACALLIIIVLIQQGRGGGLIESLSSAENIFGTKTSTFLVKATSILAVIFFFTCLSLAFLSIRKGKSLIETSYKPVAGAPAQAQGTPQTADTTTQTPAVPSTASATSAPAPEPAAPQTAPSTTTSPQQTATPTANVEQQP